VGDALVAQIPGLLISVAAAMVVSCRQGAGPGTPDRGPDVRLSARVGHHGISHGHPGIIPGMPHVVFLAIASILAMRLGARSQPPAPSGRGNKAPASSDGEASWDDLQPWINSDLNWVTAHHPGDKNRQGDLLTRIKGVRRKFAQEVGFLPPPVHVRDTWNSNPAATASPCRGVIVGEEKPSPACTWPSTPVASPRR